MPGRPPGLKVLVTGGAGFVGSHVVDALLDGGADVRVIDSLDPSVHGAAAGPGAAGAARRAAPISTRGRSCSSATSPTRPAPRRPWPASTPSATRRPRWASASTSATSPGYVAGNDTATAVLLEALWRSGFAGRLVLARSMVVYGDGVARCPVHGPVAPAPGGPRTSTPAGSSRGCPRPRCAESIGWVPVDESAPADPRNVYAATKLHQEHLCGLWGRAAGATVVALRYHNVYGPRMPRDTPYAGVASIFRSALAGGRPALVFEDGGQTRDFVHVRDVARANVLALTAAVDSGAYNIASGMPHTVLDMAAALTDAFGPDAPRPEIRGGWRPGDVRHIVASPRRAAEELGFVAEIAFDEGMAEFARAPQRASPAHDHRTRSGSRRTASGAGRRRAGPGREPVRRPSSCSSPAAWRRSSSRPTSPGADRCWRCGGGCWRSWRSGRWPGSWPWRPPSGSPDGGPWRSSSCVAVALRAAALAGPPTTTDDFYRYSWDGRVQAAGINPYEYTPCSTRLDHLREPWLWPEERPCPLAYRPHGCTRINRSGVPTIYPPVAEAWFAGIYRLTGIEARYKPWQVAGLLTDVAGGGAADAGAAPPGPGPPLVRALRPLPRPGARDRQQRPCRRPRHPPRRRRRRRGVATRPRRLRGRPRVPQNPDPGPPA